MNERDLKDYFVNCFDQLYSSALRDKARLKKKDTGKLSPEFVDGKVFGVYIILDVLKKSAEDYNIDPEALGLNDIDHEKLLLND